MDHKGSRGKYKGEHRRSMRGYRYTVKEQERAEGAQREHRGSRREMEIVRSLLLITVVRF